MAAVKSKKPTSKLKAGKKKSLNKWIIVGGVATVALVGALVVRFSGASTKTFERTSGQLASNIGTQAYGSVNYRLVSSAIKRSSGTVTTIASYAEMKMSNDVCAHFRVFDASANTTTLSIIQSTSSGNARKGTLNFGKNTKEGYVCLGKKPVAANSTIEIQGAWSDSKIGIDKIYGKL